MNIKSGSKNTKPILDIMFGGNNEKDTALNNLVMASTVGIWFASMFVGVIIYMIGNTTMVILHVLVNASLIAGLGSLIIAVIGVMAHNDWNRTYGLGMLLRIVFWGLLLVISSFVTNKYQLAEEVREPVLSFQFVRSDVKDCEAKIRMKSKSFTYDYCSSYSSDYDVILRNKDIKAVLTGGVQYGSPHASHVEFIEKSIGADFE